MTTTWPASLSLTWRAPGHLQLGVAPAAVLLAPAAGPAALRALGPARTIDQVAAGHGVDVAWLRDAAAVAARLCPAAPLPPGVVTGGGRLADAIAAGWPECRRSDAAVEGLSSGDLLILADDSPVAHRGLARDAVAAGAAVLAVTADQAGASVGPLIDGTGACLDCLDHHGRDRDPGWGLVADRLARTTVAVAATDAAWVAGMVVRVARSWRGGRAERWRSTVWSLTDEGPQRRVVPVHPACGRAGDQAPGTMVA